MYIFSLCLFAFLCLLLVGSILVQQAKGGGIGAGLGGDASALFGASAPNVMRNITAGLAIAFMLSCLLLSRWTSNLHQHSLPPQESVISTGE